MITQEVVRELFDYSNGKLFYRKDTCFNEAGAEAGSIRPDKRKEVWVVDRLQLVHRVIFLWHHGYLPTLVDHINRDSSDNRIENLRDLNKSGNCHNSKAIRSSTGYRGVTYASHVNMYRSTITVNKVKYEVGYFKTAEEASKAYERKRRELLKDVFELHE